MNGVVLGLGPRPTGSTRTRETAAGDRGEPGEVADVAIVRDEKNVVRGYFNGKHVPPSGKPDPVWDGPLGYDRFFFGDPDRVRTVLEVDEFCLFERALAADELKKLAEPAK